MAGRSLIALLVLAVAISALFLFGTGEKASAITYKIHTNWTLSCAGLDGTDATGDDSCVPGTENNPGVTADLTSGFTVDSALDPGAPHQHSNFGGNVYISTAPPEWGLARSSEIDDGGAHPVGSRIGTLVATSTLSILNGPCNTTIPVTIPLYDATTDRTLRTRWLGDGSNLVLDPDGNGLPDKLERFPAYLDTFVTEMDGGDLGPSIKPMLRGAGFTHIVAGAPPTQLEFLVFDPGAVAQMQPPAAASDMGDSLGYMNIVVLDNPHEQIDAISSITEFCAPLGTTSTVYGVSQGLGQLYAGPLGPEMGVPDPCGDGAGSDPACTDIIATNPGAGTGIFGGETHVGAVYSESFRDADGDGVSNQEDECPYLVDNGVDADGDGIDSVCDPNDGDGKADQDGDGYQNQQDNCAIVANAAQTDSDQVPAIDGGPSPDEIGDACDANPLRADLDGGYANDLQRSAVCLGLDTDGDGWCDAEEVTLGSNPAVAASMPENIVMDPTVAGGIPGTCNNHVWEAAAGEAAGADVDDDGDGNANGADAGCTCPALDTDCDGVPNASDNCANAYNPEQLNTDGDAQGDACDADDDNDAVSDRLEMLYGGQPDNAARYDLSSFGLDINGDTLVNVADVLQFKGNTLNKPVPQAGTVR